MPVNTLPPVDTAMANFSSSSRSRAHSTSSDRPSAIGVTGLMSPPLSVSPDAAFIAASAASQIVTNDHDSHSGTWYDQVGIEPAAETAFVSNGALQLANNFIDHLLFNVLATAKSTALVSLRSAVVEVLKPKLAKDVINSADEELREYLGGGEIEDLAHSHPDEAARDWDLELVWKRTRLRCMVYSSLGDMEEEDEDGYIEQEHLHGEVDDVLTELVSPAVAIFLTSVLEFMGEQVLIVAGQAAFSRLSVKYEKELKDGIRLPGDVSDRIVVEESDMERVALDRTLGRLWRAWKKRIRSPTESSSSRPFSRSSLNGFGSYHQRRESNVTESATAAPLNELDTTTDDQPSQSDGIQDGAQDSRPESESFDPSMFPLPDSDVEATYSDEEESDEEDLPPRPKSWFVTSGVIDDGNPFTSISSVKRTPSLPSRKKPRYSLVSPGEDTEKTETAIERAESVQLQDSSEVKTDAEVTAQMEVKTGGSMDDATPDTAGVGEAVVFDPTVVSKDVTAKTDIKEDHIDGAIEDFAEEPEILTSSRISVGGRSSPTFSESGRPSSIILTRSNSVRSVRVIEVQGPRSRASSIESNPRSPTPRSPTPRSFIISREGSSSRTPPIVEENDPYAVPYVTVTNTTSGTVSSYAEGIHDTNMTLAPPRRNRSPPKSTSPTIVSHTSASSNATVINNNTGIPHEERDSSSARFKPRRTSEESGSNSPADVARNFEELIQSNETLQYTLTPENMRNIDVSGPLQSLKSDLIVRQSQSPQPNGSAKGSHRSRRSEDGKIRRRSRSSSIKRSISVNQSTGLSSHPTPDMSVNGKYSNGTSKPLPPVSSRSRTGPAPQAREARVPRESMQDFAEFIRSTGPPGANITRTNGAFTRNSNTMRSVTGPPPITASSSMEARRGPRLQAREAIVTTSNESSELIDFIRRGPPSTNGNNHRIPRTVAPFRNTQDSDYMTSAVGGKAVDAIILMQQLYAGNSFDSDDMMPKRTRRRVRDPYALDFSDEEDEFDVIPQPKPKQEESLIDFLNNYPPPAEPVAQPIFLPKKKSSTPNLIARLRSGSSAGLNGSNHSRKASSVSENRSLSSRMGPRTTHTPIVVPTVADRYGASIRSPDSPRTTSFGRVPVKRFEPRDASSSRSQTADLADFLRDSRPPPSAVTVSPPSEDKVSSGFSRMFERRKKAY
ncbi:hypothetical protein CIB48_g842 [Xylaria polymorpha]|nr:hypothetical protein CIB48_g842 [Xylaria polymorpha]